MEVVFVQCGPAAGSHASASASRSLVYTGWVELHLLALDTPVFRLVAQHRSVPLLALCLLDRSGFHIRVASFWGNVIQVIPCVHKSNSPSLCNCHQFGSILEACQCQARWSSKVSTSVRRGGPLFDPSRHLYQQFVRSPHQSSLHAHTYGLLSSILLGVPECVSGSPSRPHGATPWNCDNRASPSLFRASSSRFSPLLTHSLSVITASRGSVLSIAQVIPCSGKCGGFVLIPGCALPHFHSHLKIWLIWLIIVNSRSQRKPSLET